LPAILGWDIGGANVKAALVTEGGELLTVERPFAIWRDRDRLAEVLGEVAGRLSVTPVMAVTLTAELADCFATKREGVAFVLEALRRACPGADARVFGADGRFRSPDEARARPLDVAAANWVASATLVARTRPDALFVDVGSTTTDLVPIVAGRVAVEGRTDVDRLQSGHLVYTGALRTPLCAIVSWVPVRGRRCRVAAEHFAIAADVHRWLGRIEERDYTCETPDGRGRTRDECGARLARVVCADREVLGDQDITRIAEHAAGAQVRQIADGIAQVTRRLGARMPRGAVLAGQGAFLGRLAAERAGLAVCEWATDLGPGAARVAGAAAVAYLLAAEVAEPVDGR
jgi:hypothetical protein